MGSRFRGPLTAFRVASLDHPIFDGEGAAAYGGRWNSIGRRVIYASEQMGTAMFEILVHAGIKRLPLATHFVEIAIPGALEVERIDETDVPGWRTDDRSKSRAFGDAWHEDGKIGERPAVLLVPSVVVPRAWNVIINQDHPAFAKITVSKPEPLIWDARLFRKS